MPIALNPNDEVLATVLNMQHILAAVPVRYLLTNGKIEKQLKYFMGAAWEAGNPGTRATATDKRPFNAFELDVIAFEAAIPHFWAELKCSFNQDNNDVRKSATKAVNQATVRRAGIPAAMFNVPGNIIHGYIVHFLTTLPAVHDPRLPPYILDLYQPLRGQPIFSANQLEQSYELLLQHDYHSSTWCDVWVDNQNANLTVSAVIVKLVPNVLEIH